MEFGRVTPFYVFRCWGGNEPIKEIEVCLAKIRAEK